MSGAFFARFARENLPGAFARSINPRAKRMLQDGCPCQNSAEARGELRRLGVIMTPIPPRSPDLNPIENLFAQVKRKLRLDALEKRIEKESERQFARRVHRTITRFPVDRINRLIESMDRRITLLIAQKGQRLKY